MKKYISYFLVFVLVFCFSFSFFVSVSANEYYECYLYFDSDVAFNVTITNGENEFTGYNDSDYHLPIFFMYSDENPVVRFSIEFHLDNTKISSYSVIYPTHNYGSVSPYVVTNTNGLFVFELTNPASDVLFNFTLSSSGYYSSCITFYSESYFTYRFETKNFVSSGVHNSTSSDEIWFLYDEENSTVRLTIEFFDETFFVDDFVFWSASDSSSPLVKVISQEKSVFVLDLHFSSNNNILFLSLVSSSHNDVPSISYDSEFLVSNFDFDFDITIYNGSDTWCYTYFSNTDSSFSFSYSDSNTIIIVEIKFHNSKFIVDNLLLFSVFDNNYISYNVLDGTSGIYKFKFNCFYSSIEMGLFGNDIGTSVDCDYTYISNNKHYYSRIPYIHSGQLYNPSENTYVIWFFAPHFITLDIESPYDYSVSKGRLCKYTDFFSFSECDYDTYILYRESIKDEYYNLGCLYTFTFLDVNDDFQVVFTDTYTGTYPSEFNGSIKYWIENDLNFSLPDIDYSFSFNEGIDTVFSFVYGFWIIPCIFALCIIIGVFWRFKDA